MKLAEAVLPFPNVGLFDFQADQSISNDLSRFKDPLHFYLKTTRMIMKSIEDDSYRIRSILDMTQNNRDLIIVANDYNLCEGGELLAKR